LNQLNKFQSKLLPLQEEEEEGKIKERRLKYGYVPVKNYYEELNDFLSNIEKREIKDIAKFAISKWCEWFGIPRGLVMLREGALLRIAFAGVDQERHEYILVRMMHLFGNLTGISTYNLENKVDSQSLIGSCVLKGEPYEIQNIYDLSKSLYSEKDLTMSEIADAPAFAGYPIRLNHESEPIGVLVSVLEKEDLEIFKSYRNVVDDFGVLIATILQLKEKKETIQAVKDAFGILASKKAMLDSQRANTISDRALNAEKLAHERMIELQRKEEALDQITREKYELEIEKEKLSRELMAALKSIEDIRREQRTSLSCFKHTFGNMELKQRIYGERIEQSIEKVKMLGVKDVVIDEASQLYVEAREHREEVMEYIRALLDSLAGKSIQSSRRAFSVLQKNYRHLANVYKELLAQHAICFDWESKIASGDIKLALFDFIFEQDILQNLLLNSVRVLIEFKQSDRRVWICVERRYEKNGRTFIEVHFRNNGPDIPEDKKELIFSGNYTTKPLHLDNEEHGKGLLTVRRRLEEAGGSIVETGAVDQGACFILHIPLWIEHSPKPKSSAIQAKPQSTFQGTSSLGEELTELGSEHWTAERYPNTFKKYFNAAESAYKEAQHELAEELTEVLLEKAQNIQDRAHVYELQIYSLSSRRHFIEAIELARTALAECGWSLNLKAGKRTIAVKYLRILGLLHGRKMPLLSELKPMVRPEYLPILRIIIAIGPNVLFVSPYLFIATILDATYITLKYGYSTLTPMVYIAYASFLGAVFGFYDEAYRIGQDALQKIDMPEHILYKAQCMVFYNLQIHHWKNSLRSTLPSFKEAYHIGLAQRNREIAVYAWIIYGDYAFWAGVSLPELGREIRQQKKALEQLRQQTGLHWLSWLEQLVYALEDQPNRQKMYEDDSQAEQVLRVPYRENDGISLFDFYLRKMFLQLLFKDFTGAKKSIVEAEKYAWFTFGEIVYPVFSFYCGLVYLKNKSETRQLKAIIKKFKRWAKISPQNHGHKYQLLLVEQRAKKGSVSGEEYTVIIGLAEKNGYIQEAAIAAECAAEHFSGTEQEKLFIIRAHQLYSKWGAWAKCRQMESSFAYLQKANVVSVEHKSDGETAQQSGGILIVDDDQDIVNYIAFEFSQKYQDRPIYKVTSIIRAQEIISKYQPRIIVLDLEFPEEEQGSDLLVFLESLRKSDVSIIIYSAMTNMEKMQKIQQKNYQVKEVLAKQFITPGNLIEYAEKYLS
jgi:CheY-like chemotaxis protein